MIAHEHRILWLPGEERSWDDDGGGRSPAGVRITPENATSVAAVFSCLRILAETVAGLPLHLLERTPGGGKRLARELPLYRKLHSQPNAWQTSFEWREQMVMHVGLWGDAESELVPGQSGAIDQIVPLHPSRMKTETLENGRLRYTYREAKGKQTIYTDEQILHVRGPSDDGVHGISVVEECRDAIALARACEIHGARFFGAGARPGFILSTDNQLNADARRELAENWNRKHRGSYNAHETAVLTGGLKPYEVPYASNTDSQYLELREYQLREIARLFRIPGYLLGIEPGTPQAEIQFVTHTIMPWLRRLESAFMRDLIVDDERYLVEFDVRGLLRGDAASRSAYYRAMWDIGVVSTNDIRASENLDPVDGGDERYRPLNMGTLGAPPSVGDVLAQQQPGSGIDGQAVEGGIAAAEQGQPAEPMAASETSLTTAEVSSLLTVVKQITDGMLSIDAARAIIAAAFPVLSPARVETILQGVQAPGPELAPSAAPASAPVPIRSLAELRAMTVSIDFDRTFAADPQLWGEFARKAVADGNRVVMISRRPESDREEVISSLGDYAESFSDVLLVGGDTLKADAAQAAGISVDVWVDDSPQFIRGEQRAQPGTVSEGDFVSWDSSGGRARGRIDHVMDYGTLDIPGTDFKIDATKEDPAALITLYEEVTGGWQATETQVGHKVSTLTKIDPLPEPPPVEENAYGKPKRKGRKRG
jgi:HK97 family phage portal protein